MEGRHGVVEGKNLAENKVVRVVFFGRADFSRNFIFGPPDLFLRILSLVLPSSFLWGKSAQKSPPGKSLAKSSIIYATKIPDIFLQRGRASQLSCRHLFLEEIRGRDFLVECAEKAGTRLLRDKNPLACAPSL